MMIFDEVPPTWHHRPPGWSRTQILLSEASYHHPPVKDLSFGCRYIGNFTIFKDFLRLSSSKLLRLTPHQNLYCVIEWPIYWYTTVTWVTTVTEVESRLNCSLSVNFSLVRITDPEYVSGLNGWNIWFIGSRFFHVLEKTFLLFKLNQCFSYDLSQISRPKYSESRKIQKA